MPFDTTTLDPYFCFCDRNIFFKISCSTLGVLVTHAPLLIDFLFIAGKWKPQGAHHEQAGKFK